MTPTRRTVISGPPLPKLILGMMRLFDYPELTSPAALARWIHARLDEGLDTFDHADIYGDGRCELLFGAALQSDAALQQQVRIITKASIILPNQDSSPWRIKHYRGTGFHLRRVIDDALTRLKVDQIDTFLLHRPDPLADTEDLAQALEDAVSAGKISRIGVSNFLPEQWRWLQDNTRLPLVYHQSELSLLTSQALFDGTHEAQLRDGLQWLAWSPLAAGRLMQGTIGRALADAHAVTGMSPTALAIAWIGRIPGAPIPVLGSLKPERIQEAFAVDDAELPRELWFSLLEAARGHEVA
ncbi:aldo/keto reductase [Allohahella marinimesophila]|uniref:Aldo/keto reductase n=1 Tax=Allohahella marinimesophila TaxID=1054972 RepID=A0ABP7P6I4_9GAMM